MRKPSLAALQAATLILLAWVGALGFIAVKWWFYPGWTWRGYTTDLKVAGGVMAAGLAVLTWIYVTLRRHDLGESTQGVFRQALSSARLPWVAGSLFLVSLGLSGALALVGERDGAADLLSIADQSNWRQANDVVADMAKDPMRPGLLRTLQLYVSVREAAERHELLDSRTPRDDRDEVRRLIDRNEDYRCLDTLTYAELSKMIFFIEEGSPERESIDDAIDRLRAGTRRCTADSDRSRLLAETGGLLLAVKKYVPARAAFEQALSLERDPTRMARIDAMLANTFAAETPTRDLRHATALYEAAEANYPEGNKVIFYSNFSYVLLLQGKYADAKARAERAIQIAPGDWVSHMNRALSLEGLGQSEDALAAYQSVIANAREPDMLREARILAGRCLEIGGGIPAEYFKLYLLADGRNPTASNLSRLTGSATERTQLYGAMAAHLRNTSTHGIEQYVMWFEQRSHPDVGAEGARASNGS